MIVYAETSALLSWWRGEPRAEEVRRAVAAADAVVTSDLTFLETERSIVRAEALGELTARDAGRLRALVVRASAGWTVAPISREVLDAARRAFPHEPVRALDALHLATVLVVRSAAPGLAVLALDERVRRDAEALGLEVLP